ncbi:nitroreductase [Chloroflexota bacterium]
MTLRKGGNETMDVIEVINQRMSIRAFKTDPVPLDILKRIMEVALRAPSWGNTQPWEFAIVSGRELEEIRRGFIERAEEEPSSDISRPQEFPEPYAARRRARAAKNLEIKGIRREDSEGRGWWRLQGLRHFGAPTVIYICINRSFYFQDKVLNVWPVFDCALVAENIMLAAIKYGLGTVPQAQAVAYPGVLRKVLGIPDSKLIVLGISIGYPNWDDPINQWRTDREPRDKVCKWYGFG